MQKKQGAGPAFLLEKQKSSFKESGTIDSVLKKSSAGFSFYPVYTKESSGIRKNGNKG
jgi:hypothetical protein